MPTDFFPQRPNAHPMIYAYEDTNPQYQGLLKVGYTAIDVDKRVAQQYPTKRPDGSVPYRIVYRESAMYPDGSSFTDHDVHRVLKRKQIAGMGGEWFRCTVDDVRAAVLAVKNHTANVENRVNSFSMRPEQQEAVDKTAAYFQGAYEEDSTRYPKFLWNCKMRFGKTFEEIERMYYYEHYSDHVDAQNARNEKTRHIERNRTVDDLLKNNKTCPEESIYQIGTMEESISPGTLALIVSEFYEEFERRFGSHIHILDWALHLDEGTPHIHERHVFDCKNRYGELCPQQEKALEELGVELPDPSKPKGKHNNRKQTFDAVCRTMLFDISRKHGVHLEQEPSYGGRAYLEKQDYILMKQKEQLAAQEQKLEELTLEIEDVDSLIDEVSSVAYDKAVELVTDEVKTMTHQRSDGY